MDENGPQVPDLSPALRKLKAELHLKQSLFNRLSNQFLKLKEDLVRVKREHDIRIGRVLEEIEALDFELFHFRKIKDLVDKGLPFNEAENLVVRREEAQSRKTGEFEESHAHEDPPVIEPKLSSKADAVELKKLFRKLAHKFHPDVNAGNEDTMKLINRAYAEGNLEMLRTIDRQDELDRDVDFSTESLVRRIESVEALTIRLRQKYAAFRRSEWFAWKKELEKATREKRDLFAEKERLYKREVAQKKQELTRLKRVLAGAKGKPKEDPELS